MDMSNRFKNALYAVTVMAALSVCPADAYSQSTDQINPTPLLSNEISGEIKARDIGDSRVTRYYYLFAGNRGDVFINVVTNNINGSIDIFTRNGLQPRSKITLFADSPDGETGRVVYMRESEMLILRIQGRTPNDDSGTYQIKFAGSFAPATGVSDNGAAPTVDGDVTGSVRVNSVGTIIEKPAAAEPVARVDTDPTDAVDERTVTAKEPGPEKEKAAAKAGVPIVVTTPFPPVENTADKAPAADADGKPKEVTVSVNSEKPKRSALVTISRMPAAESAIEPEVSAPAAEATLEEKLAGIQLRIMLKSGEEFTRPMNEVLSVNVIRGVLTIVTTDGRIQEFSILDVSKMSIE